VSSISRIENALPLLEDQRTLSVVNHCRRQQSQARVAVFLVVPTKEPLREGATVLKAAETIWELRPILQGAELTFRVRIVIRDMRPTMGFGNSQVGQ